MTHTWKIYDLKHIIDSGVVIDVTYACESKQGEFSNRNIGNLILTGTPETSGFIDYDSLTEADGLSWVSSNVDQQSIEDSLTVAINSQITAAAAVTEVNGKPWDNSSII